MGELAAAAAPTLILAGFALLALPHLNPDGRWPRLLGAMFVTAMLLRYMAWRVTDTLPSAGMDFNFFAAIVFLVVEMSSCLAGMLMLHALSRTTNRSAEVEAHPPEKFPGGAPLVDVLIPTYNEKREILLRTLVGALSQDYPNYRVWILDDGRRPWLQEMTEELGAHYLTRDENSHGKAGNMNAAIRKLLQRSDPPDFFAVLDADFVPTPVFLRRTVALMHDPVVACVQRSGLKPGRAAARLCEPSAEEAPHSVIGKAYQAVRSRSTDFRQVGCEPGQVPIARKPAFYLGF